MSTENYTDVRVLRRVARDGARGTEPRIRVMITRRDGDVIEDSFEV